MHSDFNEWRTRFNGLRRDIADNWRDYLKDYRVRAGIAGLLLVVLLCAWLLVKPSTQEKIAREPVIPVTLRHPASEGPLKGYVVVIDPGHGGDDPGSHGMFKGTQVYEAPYVMDVAQRLVRLVQENGGVPMLTRRTPGIPGPIDSPASVVLPRSRADLFRDGSPAIAKKVGMEKRLDVVRHAMTAFPKRRRLVWISIHFDAEPARLQLQGVSVIVPSGSSSRVGNSLLVSFGQVKRLRKRKQGFSWQEYTPLIVNGVARNLYILRNDKNPADEKVLVELGNFSDKGDVWRIRDPRIRQQYAEAILAGIEP